MFPCGARLLYVVHKTFIEVPIFQETSPAQKNFWLRTCSIIEVLNFTLVKMLRNFQKYYNLDALQTSNKKSLTLSLYNQ